ncbi:MAG: alcohol dehydrogenase catalytic domain-containing protein [Christensenellales bacterium]
MMKQQVMVGPRTSQLLDVPVPAVGRGEILVKMKYCGVCRSEHDSWREAKPGQRFGHEPVGVVAGLGADVRGFQIGERVSGLAYPALAEYVVFAAAHTVHVPENLPDEDAVAEPLSCLVSAVKKLPPVQPGTPAAVVGCGYMGLGALSLLKLRGDTRVIAVDPRPEALENARRLGADETYLPHQVPKQYLATWDNGCKGGLNVVCEWAESDESLHLAACMTAIDGTLGIGAYHTGGRRSVDMQLWNYKAITAISLHERKPDYQTLCAQEAFDLLSSGAWQFKGLKSKIYRLDQFDLAQDEIMTKPDGLIKGVIDCSKWA